MTWLMRRTLCGGWHGGWLSRLAGERRQNWVWHPGSSNRKSETQTKARRLRHSNAGPSTGLRYAGYYASRGRARIFLVRECTLAHWRRHNNEDEDERETTTERSTGGRSVRRHSGITFKARTRNGTSLERPSARRDVRSSVRHNEVATFS